MPGGWLAADVEANRPAAGTKDRYFYATDTGKLYYDDGTTWVEITATPTEHGNESHNPDFLAVDGSNKPTADIDWNSKGIREIGYLVGTKYGYGAPPLLEPLHNILACADKKWTVTVSPAPTAGDVAYMFDFAKNNYARWDNTVTLPIEITIEWTDRVNLIKVVGIQFYWSEYISGVKIEAYDDKAGAWTTLIDESNNTTNRVVWTGNLNYITKIRYTLSGAYNESVVSIANLFALSNHPSAFPYGYYFPLDTSSAIDAYMSGNKWLSVSTLGIVGLPKQSACVVRLSANTSLSHNTYTTIPFDTVIFDTQSEWDSTNYRYTASESGIYLVGAKVALDSADEAYLHVAIAKNGSYYNPTGFRAHDSKAWRAHVITVWIIPLDAGDYIEFRAYQYNYTNQTALNMDEVYTGGFVVKIA